VGRTEENCKDRYRNHLREASTRSKGHWTPVEEEKLVKCVREANRQLGRDESSLGAPWDVVCQMMGGTRTRSQCREKWCVPLKSMKDDSDELNRRETTRLRGSTLTPSQKKPVSAAKLFELLDGSVATACRAWSVS